MAHDPKQVILDAMAAPATVRRAGPAGPGGWHAVQYTGGFVCRVDPVSVQFLKELIAPGRQLHAVRFTDTAGHPWTYLFFLVQDAAGVWHRRGGGGGGGTGAWPREQPWVNLAASWGADGFCAGGAVSDNGLGMVRVRLRDGTSLLLEDTVDDGWVLFMTDQQGLDPFAMVADLYDATGAIVGSHPIV